MHYLGVDLGSSFIKGAVLDVDTGKLHHVQRVAFPEPLPAASGDRLEFCTGEILQKTQALLHNLLAAAVNPRGLFFSCQMGGLVLQPQPGGFNHLGNRTHGTEPRPRYISWRDLRTTQPAANGGPSSFAQLQQRLTESDRQSLGNEIRAGYALSLLYHAAQQGDLPSDAAPLSLGDYIIAQLTGEAPKTERTLALGLLNLHNGDWHRDLFSRLGTSGLAWPELTTWKQPAGALKGVQQPIPVYPAVGDHQCSLLGTLLVPSELSVNVSTGSQVSLLSPGPRFGPFQTRPFLDGSYLCTITHLPAGRSLELLLDLLLELPIRAGQPAFDPWPLVVQAMDDATADDLQVDLAFFAGPRGDKGAISNIRVDNFSVGALFRGALRNMADNYADCAALLGDRGAWQRIVFSGGLAQKLPLLRELVLQRLPGEHRLCTVLEDALCGLLLLARVASGKSSTVAEARQFLQGCGVR